MSHTLKRYMEQLAAIAESGLQRPKKQRQALRLIADMTKQVLDTEGFRRRLRVAIAARNISYFCVLNEMEIDQAHRHKFERFLNTDRFPEDFLYDKMSAWLLRQEKQREENLAA